MKALIIGGSSGLGLELAKQLQSKYQVFITGRKDPQVKDLSFINFDIKADHSLGDSIDSILHTVGEIELFVYAAGFFQDGNISEIPTKDILLMNKVGLLAPAIFLNRVLKIQDQLQGFIAITSTSQSTPRLKEPMYTAVKAGLGMLANSVSLDERVKKTLVAGPAGMKTPFWLNTYKDTSTMMDPSWVAQQILEQFAGDYKYKYTRILREPPRVEIVEQR